MSEPATNDVNREGGTECANAGSLHVMVGASGQEYKQLKIGSLEYALTVKACEKTFNAVFCNKASTPEQCNAAVWLLEMLVKEGKLYL